MWRLAGPEPTLDANNHQIAHHFAGDAGGRGRPGDDFPIAGVDSEQDTEELAIAASELEMIGAPTDIRAQSDHDTVVGAPWPAASVPLQGQFIDLHDPQHSLGIDCWLAFSLLLPVHQARDAPVSVGRALVHEPTDQHQQRLVCGLAIGPMRLSGASNPLDQVRTGDRKLSATAFIANRPCDRSMTAAAISVFLPARHQALP